ncbi:MAG: prepilin-type N-terminal cleavage/methylation domain-containing protein [Candidatus Eisenbacteria bacterium]
MRRRLHRSGPILGNREAGFTLIELLIAGLIFVSAVGVMLTFLSRNEEARDTSYHVTQARQNARSTLDFLVSEIRMAGSAIQVPVVTSTALGDSIILYPVNPDTTVNTNEKLTILGKFGDAETTLRSKMILAGQVTDVNSVAGFAVGNLIVVAEGSFANLFEITDIQGTSIHHDATSPFNLAAGHRPWPPGGYPVDTSVFAAELVTYYVDHSDSTRPRIMRQIGVDSPRVLSEYVNLLSFDYELQDRSIVAEPDDFSDIRKVIVTIEAGSGEPSKQHVTRLVSAARPRSL